MIKFNLSVTSKDNDTQYTKPTVTPCTQYTIIEHLLPPERNIKFIKLPKIHLRHLFKIHY